MTKNAEYEQTMNTANLKKNSRAVAPTKEKLPFQKKKESTHFQKNSAIAKQKKAKRQTQTKMNSALRELRNPIILTKMSYQSKGNLPPRTKKKLPPHNLQVTNRNFRYKPKAPITRLQMQKPSPSYNPYP